ncbi:hypothetical protein CSA80_02850 [Candidatus Saccharibacteria bacterium]|nr:MAG: hypothetical protein CR973_02970 [Candidatus Saccharibacteria bacterium]PID99030.1 MAG: hypothetical protein CSA80_02850 [Candidatus Saccharibacteria bacterium]
MKKLTSIILAVSSISVLVLAMVLTPYQPTVRAASEQCVPAGTNLSNYEAVATPFPSGGYALDGQSLNTNIPGVTIDHSTTGDAPRLFHAYSDIVAHTAFQSVSGASADPSFSATTTFVYAFNQPITNLEVDVRDLDSIAVSRYERVKIEAFYDGTPVTDKQVTLGASVVALPGDFYENQTTNESETSPNGSVIQKFHPLVNEVRVTVNSNWDSSNVVYFSGGCLAGDADEDGVPDQVDLDDDNDGILDAVECDSSWMTWSVSDPTPGGIGTAGDATIIGNLGGMTANVTNNSNYRDPVATTATSTHANYPGSAGLNNNGANMVGNRIMSLVDSAAGVTYTFSFTNPTTTDLYLHFTGFDKNVTFSSNVTIETLANGTGAGTNTFIIDPPGAPNRGGLSAVVPAGATAFSFTLPNAAGDNYFVGISGPCKDTDSDGTPDILDLDSDNDGCFDAIEGAGNFTPANLQNATGVTTGTGSPAPGNQNLGNAVDADGIPNPASPTGQDVGTSTDNTQKDADCCSLSTNDDSGSGTVGTAFTIPNVLTNDTVNGSTPTIGTGLEQVTISQSGTWDAGITLDPATGEVNVADSVSAGSYSVEYQVCVNGTVPSLCTTETVEITVADAPIVANTDSGSISTTGGEAIPNVLDNDTLNGNPATTANVTLTQVSTSNPGVTLDPATGAVNVAAGTPAGAYTVEYQICETANPTNCTTSTATVTVTTNPIVANTDSGSIASTGGEAIANVLANDTLNGNPATLADVTLSQVSTTDPGVTLDPATGAVNVAAGTAPGTYVVSYEICEAANPTNCETTTATVEVTGSPNVFDPPSARKTVSGGAPEMEWKMVWINDGNATALNTQVLDPIPANTTYVAGSVVCDARGASTTDVCTYDANENRIRWEGNIAPDPGGTDENNSANEVVITFKTTVPPEVNSVENQAMAYYDQDGDGDFQNDKDAGLTAVLSDNANATDSAIHPTVWSRGSPQSPSLLETGVASLKMLLFSGAALGLIGVSVRLRKLSRPENLGR